jgi:hypothetical protein
MTSNDERIELRKFPASQAGGEYLGGHYTLNVRVTGTGGNYSWELQLDADEEKVPYTQILFSVSSDPEGKSAQKVFNFVQDRIKLKMPIDQLLQELKIFVADIVSTFP